MVDKKSIQRLISFDDEDTSTGFVSASGDVLTFRNLGDALQCFEEFLYTKDIIVKKISSYNGGVRINLEGGLALDCMGGMQNRFDPYGVGCYDGDNLREMKLSEENISLFFKDLSLLSKEPRKHLLYAVTQLNTWKNMTVRDFNPYVERLLPRLKEFCGIYGRRYLKVNESLSELVTFDDEDTSTGHVSVKTVEGYRHFENSDDLFAQFFEEFEKIIGSSIQNFDVVQDFVTWDFKMNGQVYDVQLTYTDEWWDDDNEEEKIATTLRNLRDKKYTFYRLEDNGDIGDECDPSVEEKQMFDDILNKILQKFKSEGYILESLSPSNRLISFDEGNTSTGHISVSDIEPKQFESFRDLLINFAEEFEKITGKNIKYEDERDNETLWYFNLDGLGYVVFIKFTDKDVWTSDYVSDDEDMIKTFLRCIRNKEYCLYILGWDGEIDYDMTPSKQVTRWFQDVLSKIVDRFKSRLYVVENLHQRNLLTFDDGDTSSGFVGVSEHYLSPVYSLVKYLYEKETEWCKTHNRDDRVRLTLESLEYGKMFGLGELLYKYNADDEFWDTINPGNVYINAYVKDIDGDISFQGGWLLLYRDGNDYKVDVPGTMEYLDGEKDYTNLEYKTGIMIARGFVESLNNKKYLHESVRQTNLMSFDDDEDVSTGYVGVASEREEGVITPSDIAFLKRLGKTFKYRNDEWDVTAVLNPGKQHQAGIFDFYLDIRNDNGYIETVGWEGDFESLIDYLQTGKGHLEDYRDITEAIGFYFVLTPEFEFVEMDSRNAQLSETVLLITPSVILTPGNMAYDFRKFVDDADAFEWAQAFWENNDLDSVFRSAGMQWTSDNMDEVIDNSGMKERFQELIDFLKQWIKNIYRGS